MSTQATVQTQMITKPTFTPVASGMWQRASVHSSPTYEMPPIVHEVLHSPGQRLDTNTLALMEPRFGHDFSQVRVHTGSQVSRDLRPTAFPFSRDTFSSERKRDRGKTIIEGYGEDREKKQPVGAETEENPPSPDQTSLIGLLTKQAGVEPDSGNSGRLTLNGSSSKVSSWAALQDMPKDRGALISGTPVAKSLADISAGGGAGAAGYTD